MINPFTRKPAPKPSIKSLTPTITDRVRSVERVHNLTPAESLLTHAHLDLDADLEQQNLEPLARQYEVNPEWLMTGRGRVRQIHPMRAGWSPCTMVQSVARHWQRGELRAIEMITNRREPHVGAYSPVTIVIALAQPQLGDPYRVFETWATVRWDTPGRIVVMTMIELFLEIQQRTGDASFEPRGHSVGSATYASWENATILPVDIIAQTPPGWNPAASLQRHRHDLCDPVLWGLTDVVCDADFLLDVFDQTVAAANN